MGDKTREHAFSIELKNKECLKQITMLNEARDYVLIEGFLGELTELHFVEDVMLEIMAVNGVLRMDLGKREFIKLLQKGEKCLTVK